MAYLANSETISPVNNSVNSVNKPLVSMALLQHCVVERGLDSRWVLANCRSVAAGEYVPELGYSVGIGWDEKGNRVETEGILLKGVNGEVQYRPFVPYLTDKDKEDGVTKTAKYRSKSKTKGQYDIWLPTNPNNPNYWNDLEELKKHCIWKNGIPFIDITEGAFKAIAGCSNGLPTIALLGVEMGLTPKGKASKSVNKSAGSGSEAESGSEDSSGDNKRKLVPGLQEFVDAGFGFRLAFDADVANNPNVYKAQKKYYVDILIPHNKLLIATGQWTVKEGKGMDDFIKKNGIEEFRKRLERSLTVAEWEKQFGEPPTKNNSPSKLGKKFNPLLVAQEIADKIRDTWKYHNEQQVWRHFNGKVWEAVDGNVFSEMVYQLTKTDHPVYETFTALADVLKFLKYELLEAKWQTFPRHQWVAFNNCVLNIETGEMHDHSPGYRFTSYLPRDYSPIINDENLDAIALLNKHCPSFYQWAMNAMNGDVKRVFKLLSIVNAALRFKFHEWHTFVHLVGEARTGKGTFARILEKIVGEENSRSSRLNKLDIDTEVARVIDAQLVVCPDEDKKVGNHANFKSMTGGDKISYREIYKQGAEAKFYGLLLVISNYPVFAGDTTGIHDRLCLIHFNNPISKSLRNSKVESEIEAELSALASIALGLDDTAVKASIKGLGDADVPEFRLQEWSMRCQSDTLAAFIEDAVVYEKDTHSSVSDMFKAYQQHAEDSGAKGTYKLQNFSEQFVRLIHWHELECQKKKFPLGFKLTNVRLRGNGDKDVPTLGELIGSSPMQTPCIPDADHHAYLQPAPSKDSADLADLEANNKQGSIYDFLPPVEYPLPEPEPEVAAFIKEEPVEPATSAQLPAGTGFAPASEPAPSLQEPAPGLQEEPAPLEVGDRVTHVEEYNAFSQYQGVVTEIRGEVAVVKWETKKSPVCRHNFSELRRVANDSANNSTKLE